METPWGFESLHPHHLLLIMTYPKELSELSFAKAAMPCARLGITDTHIYGHTDEILMRVRREVCPRDVKSSEWRDYRSTYRGKQDAPDIREETTYRDCVSWSFRPGKFLLEICMFDGDMMYGQPEGGGSAVDGGSLSASVCRRPVST